MRAILLSSLLLIASHASATIFEFEDLNANNGGIADELSTVNATFNDATNDFTWDVTFNDDPTTVDGFWLVVNNGPNPKSSNVNELAIMYGDMDTGVLTTYAYNGQNNSNSIINPGILLQTDTFAVTDNSISIDIDATAINAWNAPATAPDYTGIAFDQKIGIWFHISKNSTFGYDALGEVIESYGYGAQGWYDKADLNTITVPAPASLLLLGLGLIGFGSARKRSVSA